MLFKGVCTALITPFDNENKIDYKALERLINFQIQNGVKNILLLGSTGEGEALSQNERMEVVDFAKSVMPAKAKLIVGAGSNTPEKSIQLILEAQKMGADGCLIQTPYFNRCTQDGIIAHFEKICENVDIPIIVYNIPSRSGVNIMPKTMARLSQFENIVGLKEANGNIDHILEMFNLVKGRLPIYCGNDNLNYLFKCLGGDGTISVTSNVFPKEIVNLFERERESDDKFYNFYKLLFCEPNPIPVKYAVSKLGLAQNNLRLPLTRLSKNFQNKIRKEMKILGAI